MDLEQYQTILLTSAVFFQASVQVRPQKEFFRSKLVSRRDFGQRRQLRRLNKETWYYYSGVSNFSACGGGGIRSVSMTTQWMTLAVVPMLLPLSRMLRLGPPLTKISNLALILLVENHSASGYSSLSCLYNLQLTMPSFPSSSFFSYESVEQLSFLQAFSPFSRVMLLIFISGSASAFQSLIVILGSREFMILMHCSSKLGYRLANLPFFARFTMYYLTIFLICFRTGSILVLEKTTCPDFCAKAAC